MLVLTSSPPVSSIRTRSVATTVTAPMFKGEKGTMWPCCDNCGGYTTPIPPQCNSLDVSRGGCHPACRDCFKSSLSVDPPVYQCMDRITNFCAAAPSPPTTDSPTATSDESHH